MSAERMLVGVDFSNASLAGARWAAAHLSGGDEITLVHVIPLPRIPSFLRGELNPPDALLREVAPAVEGGLRGFANSLGVPCTRTELLMGLPSDRIATLAEELRPDMVVVGRTGQRAGTWKRIGSTADRLMRRVRSPVLVTAGSLDAPPRRILAAVDDADVGQHVLDSAHSLAERFNAEVIALHVLNDRLHAYMAATAPGSVDVRVIRASGEASLRATTHSWLRDGLTRAGFDGTARTEVSLGDAGHEILVAAGRLDADMIIMGSYGADALARSGTGGVTRFVVRGASRPVLVLGNGPASGWPPDRAVERESARVLAYSGRRANGGSEVDGNGGGGPDWPGRPPAA